MTRSRAFSRRSMLKLSAGIATVTGASLLAACGSAPPAPPTSASPSGAAGSTPAAVTPQKAAVSSPTAGGQGSAQLDKSMVGKLEGASVVTDPAQYPKSFKESPQLADLVKAGKLPAIKDRIGDDPLVVKPLHESGSYGGTLRRFFTGPGDYWNGLRAASGPDRLLFFDDTGNKVVPNVAKAWEVSDGGKTTTIHLRKGMKWSDGQPFTADDIMFWYEDIFGNKDLLPSHPAQMTINGKPVTIEKIDEVTVAFKAPDPYYLLPMVLAGSTPLGGDSYGGRNNLGLFAPAHYLKQFHPKYQGQDKVDQMAKAAKYDNWVTFFTFKNTWGLNPELPTISPWLTRSPINTPNWSLERNPYSVWVDTDGKQLPYIDKMTFTLAENIEVVNLHAIAGDIDFQGRHIDIGKLPVLLQNQAKGDYKVHLDPAGHGADCGIWFNLSYEDDPEIAKWISTADFRRALSLGIDRDQLNETFWLGLGTVGSVIPDPQNPYYPGDEYRTLWSSLDLKKANQMLDKVGLDKKDGEGYRQRTDGKGRLRLQVDTEGGQFIQFTKIMEMVREQWKKIGIDLTVTELERSAAETRHTANKHQLFAWQNDGSDHLFNFPDNVFPVYSTSATGPLFGKWFTSGGAQGKEPPARMKDLMAKWRKAFGVPEEEQISLGKDIWKIMVEEQYMIGTVGLSPAILGVRVAKNKLGNVPQRQANTPDVMTPAISRTMTFYWKS